MAHSWRKPQGEERRSLPRCQSPATASAVTLLQPIGQSLGPRGQFSQRLSDLLRDHRNLKLLTLGHRAAFNLGQLGLQLAVLILNRGGPLSSDRLIAARDILDWNGYDTTRLVSFTR